MIHALRSVPPALFAAIGVLMAGACSWSGSEPPAAGVPSEPAVVSIPSPAAPAATPVEEIAWDPLLATRPVDATSARPALVTVHVHQIGLPAGTMSRNAAFWKRIDESALPPGLADNLQRNGIRVGVAAADEWAYFAEAMSRQPAKSVTARGATSDVGLIEIAVKRNVSSQDLFVFDRQNRIEGRTFDDCDNFILVSFRDTPRKPGYVRVSVVPMVRATRFKTDFSAVARGEEVKLTRFERQFEVGLSVDVPPQHLLILSASEEARRTTSAGSLFLMSDDAAELTEHVLVIVPKAYREMPATRSTP